METRIPESQGETLISLYYWLKDKLPQASQEFAHMLDQCSNGVTLTIEPFECGHTRQQENYYRKWCRQFADHCGMTPDEMHEEILCECFGSETVNTKFGPRRRPLKRSSGAKRGDYSHLIDTLTRVAADMGFDVPPPAR